MEDIKAEALSEKLNEADPTSANKNEVKEENAELICTEATDTVSPAESKPKARRKAAPKPKTTDTAEIPSEEKKPARKRTAQKKTSATAKSVPEDSLPKAVVEVEVETKSEEIKEAFDYDGASLSVVSSVDLNEDAQKEEIEATDNEATEATVLISPSENTQPENFEDAEQQISFFTISSAEFDGTHAENGNQGDTEVFSEDAEESDEEIITPPDELFAYRSKPQEETVTENEQESEEDVDTIDTEEEEQEENVNDDGQYLFSDLEPTLTQNKEKREPALDKYDPKKPRKIDGRFDLIELFVFTLIAVMILTTFFFRHSIVEGDSMKNTLHSGEHLIISDFFYTPKRGDIIVCEDYTTSIKKPIVKRVIALEGDVVTITADKRVYVNEELLDESEYVYVDGIDLTRPIYNFKVPENELFVMGDHRNDSEDSRSIGTISEDAVLGKVILRFYPFDKFGFVK